MFPSHRSGADPCGVSSGCTVQEPKPCCGSSLQSIRSQGCRTTRLGAGCPLHEALPLILKHFVKHVALAKSSLHPCLLSYHCTRAGNPSAARATAQPDVRLRNFSSAASGLQLVLSHEDVRNREGEGRKEATRCTRSSASACRWET